MAELTGMGKCIPASVHVVSAPEPMNAAVTPAEGTMDRKVDFINKSMDPVKNIAIDRVNF